MRRKIVIGAPLVLVLVGLLYHLYGGSEAPAGQPRLVSVTADNFPALKSAFNHDQDSVRVVVLLSPT